MFVRARGVGLKPAFHVCGFRALYVSLANAHITAAHSIIMDMKRAEYALTENCCKTCGMGPIIPSLKLCCITETGGPSTWR